MPLTNRGTSALPLGLFDGPAKHLVRDPTATSTSDLKLWHPRNSHLWEQRLLGDRPIVYVYTPRLRVQALQQLLVRTTTDGLGHWQLGTLSLATFALSRIFNCQIELQNIQDETVLERDCHWC